MQPHSKSFTGGEPITARFMRRDNFTYLPQFKLVFAGNHQPELRHVDDAMRRRVHMVPFTNKPSRPDPELGAKLREEWPAILAWAVEGCLAWQHEGLNPPAIVRTATDDYFSEEDLLGQWLEEACERRDGETCALKDLFASWREYANALGQQVGHDRLLSRSLRARGFKSSKHSLTRATHFVGITLRPEVHAGLRL